MPEDIDSYWMQKALDLAQMAKGLTSPNPMVGAVITDSAGNLIAEGYHQKAGTDHAEVVALKKAGERAEGATLYVNLEPCAHYGKTPPCVEAIIKHKIKRVVIGTLDPNLQVNGKGVQILEEAGIETKSNVLAQQCLSLNKFFFHWIKTKKPYISLKIAASLDGKIGHAHHQAWITGAAARQKVHELRAEYDAVLTGSGTILADNPQLTVRMIEGRNPLRVILDRRLRCSPSNRVFQEIGQSILFTQPTNIRINHGFPNTQLFSWPGNLDEVLSCLAEQNILSVLIEAGTGLNSAFLQSGLVNEIWYFINPSLIGSTEAPIVYSGAKQNFQLQNFQACGDDLLLNLLKIN